MGHTSCDALICQIMPWTIFMPILLHQKIVDVILVIRRLLLLLGV